MLRLLLALGASAFAATTAAAATYSAKPTTPLSETRIFTRNIVWACGPAACLGATDHSRPLVICQGLAKKAGRIDSFIVNGRALDQTQLDRCNASARATADPALADARRH